MEEAGLEFRVTMDLDIVLCIEVLDADFVRVFWDFIRAGRYQNKQKNTEANRFYRFYELEDKDFPEMLGIFSRIPETLVDQLTGTYIPQIKRAKMLKEPWKKLPGRLQGFAALQDLP